MLSRVRLDITDSKYEEVIKLIKAEKPITKKRACEILGIAYNTTRLDTLLTAYTEKLERINRRKAEKRGKPLSLEEKRSIIEGYLDKETMSNMTDMLARSSATIQYFIDACGLPKRDSKFDYFNTPMIGDSLVKEHYDIGTIVYSAQYQQVAEITSKVKAVDTAYRIWLNNDMQFACVPWYEIADLTVFKVEYGANIKIKPLGESANSIIAETLRNIKKLKEV